MACSSANSLKLRNVVFMNSRVYVLGNEEMDSAWPLGGVQLCLRREMIH